MFKKKHKFATHAYDASDEVQDNDHEMDGMSDGQLKAIFAKKGGDSTAMVRSAAPGAPKTPQLGPKNGKAIIKGPGVSMGHPAAPVRKPVEITVHPTKKPAPKAAPAKLVAAPKPAMTAPAGASAPKPSSGPMRAPQGSSMAMAAKATAPGRGALGKDGARAGGGSEKGGGKSGKGAKAAKGHDPSGILGNIIKSGAHVVTETTKAAATGSGGKAVASSGASGSGGKRRRNGYAGDEGRHEDH